MGKVYKRGQIQVEVVLKSINVCNGQKIVTFKRTYPRIIHAEMLKHSMTKCNTASSRAIPVKTMNETILDEVAMPVRFGQNQAGMQDKGDKHDAPVVIDGVAYRPQEAWSYAAKQAVKVSNAFAEAGYHKQVCNRLTEPFQFTVDVFTATELANLFWLRCDKDADPTAQVLAELMYEAYMDEDDWQCLTEGEWHLPFVECKHVDGEQSFFTWDVDTSGTETDGFMYEQPLTLEEAKKISMSVCAQASYRKADSSLEKALTVEQRLFTGNKVHASPSEHQAMAFDEECVLDACDVEGLTHQDVNGNFWSGNLKGFVQLRQLIPNNYQHDMNAVVEQLTTN